jgi:hypothetical protein
LGDAIVCSREDSRVPDQPTTFRTSSLTPVGDVASKSRSDGLEHLYHQRPVRLAMHRRVDQGSPPVVVIIGNFGFESDACELHEKLAITVLDRDHIWSSKIARSCEGSLLHDIGQPRS